MHSSCMHVCMYVSCYDHRLQVMTRSTSFKGLLTSRFIQMIYLSRLVRHCVHYGASVYKINRLVVIKIPDRYETFGGGVGHGSISWKTDIWHAISVYYYINCISMYIVENSKCLHSFITK